MTPRPPPAGRRLPTALVPVLVCLCALVVGSADARSETGGRPTAAARVRITLDLAPRHADALERLAARSSGRPPLPPAEIRRRFLPSRATVRRIRRVLAADGWRAAGGSGLTLGFTGPAAAVSRTFGARLVRSPGGGFRSSGAVRLPASLTGLVTAVEGLDTSTPPRPLATPPGPALRPACAAATGLKSRFGGFLPQNYAAPGAYRHGALLAGGYDGDGERIAFVEFSGYRPSDVAVFQSCLGLDVPVTDVPVAGGTRLRYAGAEVALDVETAIAAAPGLDGAYVYIAPPALSMAAVLNRIVADRPSTGVTAISISWGRCERLEAPSHAAATARALQLAALAGISVFTASGDGGSLDCFGLPPAAVDDPASQPFATAVGGTLLQPFQSPPHREVVWNDATGASGGGISRFWSRPAWQAGPGVLSPVSSGAPCAAGTGVCRQVPDIALNSGNGRHGTIVYCTTADCGGRGWLTIGGTSAAAPLMAGITASMNEFSRRHGGPRLGFASPFLYQQFRTERRAFRDITIGDNGPGSSARYPATRGYDMATGVGSVNAVVLAARLAGWSRGSPAPSVASLTGRTGDVRLRYGGAFTTTGRLTDDHGAVSGARVWLEVGDSLGIRTWAARTSSTGRFSFRLTTQVRERSRWRVVYVGDAGRTPAVLEGGTIVVVPRIGVAAGLPVVGGGYRAHAGVPFLLRGRTWPSMDGRTLLAQYRRVGSAVWRPLLPDTVGRFGILARPARLPAAGRFLVRWRFLGGPASRWPGAVSPSRLVVVAPS